MYSEPSTERVSHFMKFELVFVQKNALIIDKSSLPWKWGMKPPLQAVRSFILKFMNNRVNIDP